MEWSIQQVARIAGTTSRTLRHYDDTGLLHPSRVAHNGYRYYDAASLVRLQRILLLRELGLGLAEIARVLARETSEQRALETHLDWLRKEQERLARQTASVEMTLSALRGGEQPMAENMFDGFDHTAHKEEVTRRWGADAYERSDAWWRNLAADDREAWQRRSSDLVRDWVALAESGAAPESAEAHAVARQHVAWLRSIPGTPATGSQGDLKAYVVALGEMYVADPRFGANYATAAGGSAGAEFVRDALRSYADSSL